MTINEVTGGGLVPDPIKVKKGKDGGVIKVPLKDTAEVSDEAKQLFQTEREHKIREIEEKIESGYYLQHEVTEKIAEAMLKSIRKPSA